MVTRKHFKLVADLISKIENEQERKRTAELNATAFKRENPRFDNDRFMAACNVKPKITHYAW